MPLFQRNGKPILFHLINLKSADHAALKELIEREGGRVTDDDELTVKFTSKNAYARYGPLVRAKIYDVAFIEECVKQRKIVRPKKYRLDKPTGLDDFYVQHFLYGKCKNTRHRQEGQAELQSIYSADTLPDSDASTEPITSTKDDSEDESQEVLSATDLKKYESTLAGGDSPACYGNGEKRLCNSEYERKFKPERSLNRRKDCATENDSRLRTESDNRRDRHSTSRNWYQNPNTRTEVEKKGHVEQELDEDWTNVDMSQKVEAIRVKPEARMLSDDTSVMTPVASQSDNWNESSMKIIANSTKCKVSMDGIANTPDLSPMRATNNYSDTNDASSGEEEPIATRKRKYKFDKSGEQRKCGENHEKVVQRRHRKLESDEDDDHDEPTVTTQDIQKRKTAYRRLPKFRSSLRADISDDSSVQFSESSTSSPKLIEDNTSTVLSEPEVISDDDSEDNQQSHKYARNNAAGAGPSGIRNPRSHRGNDHKPTEGKYIVKNVANRAFFTNPKDINDEVRVPEVKYQSTSQSSRNKEWRAGLKKQTDAQYTGTNSRRPFTMSERKVMLDYLTKNKCISRAKGLVVWKQMITNGKLTDRTPQSLQNHFRKAILPYIHEADWLKESDMQKFLTLRGDGDNS